MKEKAIIRDLTVGSPTKQLLVFSLPFIFANLLQQVYNMADMVIIGQFVGSAGLAAASNSGELAMFFLFIGMGFANAGQVIISQHIGAGNRDKLRTTIGTLFTFGFILAACCTVLSLCLCDRALRLVNIPREAMKYAHDYAFTYFCGMIPVFGYNMVSAILRGMGDSKHPFVFIAISAVLNIVLDLLFVGVFHMECFGAALATVISQTVSFVVSIIFLYKHRDSFGFDFRRKSFRIDRQALKPIVRLGLPISIQSIAISGSMLYINSHINSLGIIAAAATAVGNKITLIATICTQAMQAAGNSIVAQNFGARKFDRVSSTLLSILCFCLVFCLLLGILLLIFPEQIFSVFDRDPEVLKLSHRYAIYCIINLLGFATRAAGFSLLNGIGYASLSFGASILDGIVARIGFSLLFGEVMHMGIEGYWLGGAIAGNVIGVVCVFYYLSGRWKKRQLLV
ncbi:MAG: MATE family efflux transporter [Oscillospiraceae bacterium]|nr:MATE family efflux transporter [Oscillospiraceae bacterium]